MYRQPAYPSIWDLAHHWHDVMVPIEAAPLPPAVRSLVTSLLEAILNSELGVYEPVVMRVVEGGPAGQTNIYMHHLESLPPCFEDMYFSGVYDAQLLAAYRLKSEDVSWWAATNGADDFPDSCIPDRARSDADSANVKIRPEAEDKAKCQEIALRLWAQDDQIRMAAMARSKEIQIEGSGRLYTPTTVVGWLREVAPPSDRNRRGRPTKKIER